MFEPFLQANLDQCKKVTKGYSISFEAPDLFDTINALAAMHEMPQKPSQRIKLETFITKLANYLKLIDEPGNKWC